MSVDYRKEYVYLYVSVYGRMPDDAGSKTEEECRQYVMGHRARVEEICQAWVGQELPALRDTRDTSEREASPERLNASYASANETPGSDLGDEENPLADFRVVDVVGGDRSSTPQDLSGRSRPHQRIPIETFVEGNVASAGRLMQESPARMGTVQPQAGFTLDMLREQARLMGLSADGMSKFVMEMWNTHQERENRLEIARVQSTAGKGSQTQPTEPAQRGQLLR